MTDHILGRFGVPPEAESIWRLLIDRPMADINEVAQRADLTPTATRAAIEALFAARLVQRSSNPIGAAVIDPALAIESHIGRVERQLSEELLEAVALRTSIPSLATAYARGRAASRNDEPGFEIVGDIQDIRRQLYLAGEATETDTRSLYHSSTVEGFRDAVAADLAVMARGVRCRSIVAPGELNSPEIYAELEAAHARGESLRTHPNIPTRLQIYDRKLAVLRVDPTTFGAAPCSLELKLSSMRWWRRSR
jgi:hypothetical protein